MRFITLFVLFFGFSAQAFAEVVTYACEFDYRIDEDGKAPEHMRLIFTIDTITQRGFMQGNLGISDVEIFVGDEAFSFTEKIASGSIQTTTITRDGLAVHSRNTVMLGEIVAVQHFGICIPE